MRGTTTALGAALLLVLAAGCGDDGTDGSGGTTVEQAEAAVEGALGENDVDLKGDSPLDAAAYALVSVQDQVYADYEIDGDTVRLIVRDEVDLGGTECIIVNAATDADYPDTAFVLVDDGEETVC